MRSEWNGSLMEMAEGVESDVESGTRRGEVTPLEGTSPGLWGLIHRIDLTDS